MTSWFENIFIHGLSVLNYRFFIRIHAFVNSVARVLHTQDVNFKIDIECPEPIDTVPEVTTYGVKKYEKKFFPWLWSKIDTWDTLDLGIFVTRMDLFFSRQATAAFFRRFCFYGLDFSLSGDIVQAIGVLASAIGATPSFTK